LDGFVDIFVGNGLGGVAFAVLFVAHVATTTTTFHHHLFNGGPDKVMWYITVVARRGRYGRLMLQFWGGQRAQSPALRHSHNRGH
jgi:hypothetical protein